MNRLTLKQKIIDYFAENPDEELTRADMIAKFGGSMKTLELHLKFLRSNGFLESSPTLYRRKIKP